MKLKKGTIVCCPKCEMPQMVSTKDIQGGQQLKDAGWESLGYDFMAQFMNCFKCGELWARRHPKDNHPQIHVQSNGWIGTQTEVPKNAIN